MNQIELLARQTENAYQWVNKLLLPVPESKWDIMPEVMESSLSWQAGHLIISFYYHSVMVTVGHQPDILQQIPMKEYSQLFHQTSAGHSAGKANPEDLKKHLQLMEQLSMNIIRSLPEDNLEKPLLSTPMPHPIAQTIFEALDWNIKHTLWHCGQIAMLKRVVDERYHFGLR